MDPQTEARFTILETEVKGFRSDMTEALHRIELSLNRSQIHQSQGFEQIKALDGKVDQEVQELDHKVEALNLTLNGNGGKPGLKTRLQLLEQTEETRRWSLRGLWAMVTGIFIRVLWDLLGKS